MERLVIGIKVFAADDTLEMQPLMSRSVVFELPFKDLAKYITVIVNSYHTSGLDLSLFFEITCILLDWIHDVFPFKKMEPLVLKLCYFHLWHRVIPWTLD